MSTPTLRWVSISGPQQTVPLTEGDYVLDSVFNPRQGVWEVLVLVKPTESDEEEDEEAEEEEE